VLSLFVAALLASEDPPAPDDTSIVVTASRTGTGPAADLSTITADDIARRQPVTLLDTLQDVAGVRAFSTGGVGGGSYVSIRGGEPNFTLILLDGIRVNDPTNSKGGAFDFGQIDPAVVQSIEVSRGAGSAVHGSDALAGVINIRLRDPVAGAQAVTARIDGDTLGDRGAGLTMAEGWRDGGLLLSGSWFDSGDSDPGSSLKRAQGLGRLRQRIGGFDVTALGLYAHGDRSDFPEDSGGPLYAINRERETGTTELWATGLAIRRAPGAALRPNVSISYARQRDDSVTPAIAPGVLDAVPALDANDRLTRLEAIGDLTVDTHSVTATIGVDYRREHGRSDGDIDFGPFSAPVAFAIERVTTSGFAEATLRPFARLTLNAGGRYDKVSHGPGETTGRAGIEWQPFDRAVTLFARIGEGFKLPSFYALGHPLVGNPDLRPERSRSVEAGVDWKAAAGTSLRFSWYDNHYRDLIDFDPASFVLVNRAHVEARGFEATATWRVAPSVALCGNLTRVVLDSETPLRGRPGWLGNVRAIWSAAARLELNAAIRFNGDFNDSSVPTGPVVTQGYAEADIGARYRFSSRLDLDIALRNLANSHYQDAVGWPARGRFLRATLSAALF
jgi:vitamin B12 transporter